MNTDRPAFCFECDNPSACASAELCYAHHKDFPKLETTGMPKGVQKTDSITGIKVICNQHLSAGTIMVSPDIWAAIKASTCKIETHGAESGRFPSDRENQANTPKTAEFDSQGHPTPEAWNTLRHKATELRVNWTNDDYYPALKMRVAKAEREIGAFCTRHQCNIRFCPSGE